jgi:hypothetical protein
MKSSTVLGIGLLAVLGVGAYIYLKNKKATTSSVTVPSTKKTSNTTSVTPSVADASLGLQPKATIDTVVSAFSETQTENYKKAKVISKEVEVLNNRLRTLNSDYARERSKPFIIGNSMTGFRPDNKSAQIKLQINSVEKQMSEKTAQANALGYKILPYGEIEKM